MRPRPLLTIAFPAIACLLAANTAVAAQFTWIGYDDTDSGSWDATSYCWFSNGAPTTWASGSSNGAVFNLVSTNGYSYVTVETAVTAGSLTFEDTPFYLIPSGTGALALSGSAAIYVANGCQANIDLSLGGTNGMTLSGSGELVLGAANTYSGTTTVSGGCLKLAVSNSLPGGNLTINGGVVELGAGSLALGLGSGAGQVQLTSNGGGFAAVGANCAVNLGGLSATMTWGSTYFLHSGSTLILGSPQADSTIDFQNPINLGATSGTVHVNAGLGTAAVDAKLSGVLSGGGGLIVTGAGGLVGVLALTASNIFSGGLVVGDSVVVSASNAAALGSGGVTLAGGTLRLAVALSGTNAVSLAANSTIDVTGVTAGTLGNLTIPGNTLYVTGGGTAANSAYSLTLGNGTLSGKSALNVADNGSGLGMLTLGSLTGGTAAALIKQGNGALVLSGSDTYGGGTTVADGILDLMSASAFPSGTSLTVEAGSALFFAPALVAAPLAGSSPSTAPAGAAAAVPEPGAWVLLATGIVAAAAWRRKN